MYPAKQVEVLSLQWPQRLDALEQRRTAGALYGQVQQRFDLRAKQLAEGKGVDQRFAVLGPDQLEDEQRITPVAGVP
ncbi:hypothetical protein D3C77_676420 [compost metagenome]